MGADPKDTPRSIAKAKPTLFTIGHSTRTLEEFATILRTHGVAVLVDVRTVPRSRRVPQFNAETLGHDLARWGIEYLPMPALGGLRKPRPDSPNAAWRNTSFRGYADYMQTPAFQAGLEQLIQTASARPTAIMCAEAVPWRCHRSLIGDALIVRGWQVMDLMGERSVRPHKLTDFARVKGTQVTYPPAQAEQAAHSGHLRSRQRNRAPARRPEGVIHPGDAVDHKGIRHHRDHGRLDHQQRSRLGNETERDDKRRRPGRRMAHIEQNHRRTGQAQR